MKKMSNYHRNRKIKFWLYLVQHIQCGTAVEASLHKMLMLLKKASSSSCHCVCTWRFSALPVPAISSVQQLKYRWNQKMWRAAAYVIQTITDRKWVFLVSLTKMAVCSFVTEDNRNKTEACRRRTEDLWRVGIQILKTLKRSAINTQKHAHNLQEPPSRMFHSTQSPRRTAYIYIFSQPLPPDHREVGRHSWNCITLVGCWVILVLWKETCETNMSKH